MFDQVFDNLRKATEATIQMQQELFQKWVSLWPTLPTAPATVTEPAKFQKKWLEIVGELLKKQRETLEAQFSTGLRNIEAAFHLAEAKNPEELRTKTVELWQKSFECLQKTYEAQMHEFQNVAAKWVELVTKGAA
jgi:hypothetical protein